MATPPSGPLGTLSRATTPERVAAALTTAILGRNLPPGAQLVEVDIAAQFGVSRHTVREAFRILGREGFVEHAPHRGVSVRAFTADEVADIYRVRRLLEVEGVRMGATATAAAVARVTEAAGRFDLAARRGRWTEGFEADLALHAGLVALVGSPTLDALMLDLLRSLRLAHYLLPGADAAGFRRSRSQHRDIVRALKARDRRAARTAVLHHLDDAEALLCSALREQDGVISRTAGRTA